MIHGKLNNMNIMFNNYYFMKEMPRRATDHVRSVRVESGGGTARMT